MLEGAGNLYSAVQGPYDPTSVGMAAKKTEGQILKSGDGNTQMYQDYLKSNSQFYDPTTDVSKLGLMSDGSQNQTASQARSGAAAYLDVDNID